MELERCVQTQGNKFCFENFSTMTGGAFLLSQKWPVKLRVSRGAFLSTFVHDPPLPAAVVTREAE